VGLTDNVISQQKAAMDRVRWESEEQCPQQTLHSLLVMTQTQVLKITTPKQTLWLIFGGNKPEINNSTWVLEPFHI
jgi:hypothetical protein